MSEATENFPNHPSAMTVVGEATPPRLSREAFVEQALAVHEAALMAYATTILNDLDRARDVVQDTFIRLCAQDPGKLEAGLKSWLFTVCRNRALDVLRKDKRSQPLDDLRWKKFAGPGLQPDEQADRQERLLQITGVLDRLSANQREVITLKFQQDLSYREIHEITGLSTGNIGFLIHAGLKRLREILPSDLRS